MEPDRKIHRERWLCRAAMTALAVTLSHVALAQSATPLTFAIPAIQGPGTPGYGVIADPTIQIFVAPGIPAASGWGMPIDLQGNGHPDVMTCDADLPPNPIVKVPCRILRPHPDGSVTDVTRQLLGDGALPSMTHPREIAVGDFNHDGRPDIFIAAHGYDVSPIPGELNTLLISNTDGTYTDRSSTLPQIIDASHSACTGDIDGDGNLDIYVGNVGISVRPSPYFLMGKGDGTFTQKSSGLPPQIQSLQEEFLSCALIDIDQDGSLDLVLGTNGGNGYADNIVLFNDGSGDFTRRPRTVLPPWPQHTMMDIATLDINRDGWPDLIVVSTTTAYTGLGLQVLINQGNGTFADETATRMPASTFRDTGPWCHFLRLADFNGDGWEDLYCQSSSWNDGYPRLWLNNGNGSWASVPQETMPKDSTLGKMHAVDFDGDGRPDILRLGWGVTGADIGYKSFLNRTPRTIPSEPIIGKATAGYGQVSISFAASLASGTSPITRYTATCRLGAGVVTNTGLASPITVSGLTSERSYACSVTATSAAGASLSSATVTVRVLEVPPRRREVRH